MTPGPGTLMELLSDRRRRLAIAHLARVDGEVVELDDLAAAVATRESGGVAPPCERVKSVAVSLHHVHLPKLADAGTIDYDARSGTIRYRRHAELESWLAAVDGEEIPGR